MEAGNSPSAGRRRVTASGPRSKYAPRACLECRRRRVKCDGQKPSCARCLSRSKACVFTGEADNRGSAPKSYVALLQARIKLLEQVLWIHSIDVDASIAKLDAQRAEVDAGPSTAAYSSSLAFTELCAGLEGALYVDEPLREPEQQVGEACFFGVASGRLELQSPHDVSIESPDVETSPSTDNQSQGATRYITEISESDISAEDSGVHDLVTSDLKERLIDLFFLWEQPWCHMVDEKLFRQSLQSHGRYSSCVLLYGILAVGSRYSDETETRSDPGDPNTAGRVFANKADVLLQGEIKVPSITTIQALGVLGLYHVGIGSDSLGWLYHGMANQMVLDMGLNLDNTTVTGMGALTSEDVYLRRQLYWALYCNDKLWASYTGRVCTMLDSQGAVPLPAPGLPDDTQSGGLSKSLPRFQRAMVTHCQILEKIMMNLYAPKRLASAAERRTFFDSCILTLRGWYYSLPKELKVKAVSGTIDPAPSPHACILNMVYHTSVVLLAKPFLRLDQKAETRVTAQRLSEQDDMFRRASNTCLEAAGEICLLTERYRELFGSFRQSPLTATHCTLTAALVVMFVPPISGERALHSNSAELDACMKTLRELSVSWGPPLRYWRTLSRMISKNSHQNSDDAGTTPMADDSAQNFANEAVVIGGAGLTISGIPAGVDSLQGLLGEPPGDASQPPHVGGAEEDPNVLETHDISMPDSQQNWDHTATAQLFTEVGYLNFGAFDALSWDQANQDAFHFHYWEPGNSWQ